MNPARLGLIAVLFGAAACVHDVEPTASVPSQPVLTMTGPEEEVFGDVLVGQGLATGGATLEPQDAATWARLRTVEPGSFVAELSGGQSGGWSYGWFEPTAPDGPCRGDVALGEWTTLGQLRTLLVNGYLGINGRTRTLGGGLEPHYEVHPIQAGELEHHCARAGKYSFEVTPAGHSQSFIVEHLNAEATPDGYALVITPGNWRVEADNYSVTDDNGDLIINVQFDAPTPAQETPVLQVQNSGANRVDTFFTDQNPAWGQGTDWFRFGVMQSSSTWQGPHGSRGSYIARLYYDYGVDQTIRTEYYSVPDAFGMIRTHQFQSHVTGTRCVIVGFEMKRPDEAPAPVADATRQVGIGATCPSGPDLMPMPISLSATTVQAGGQITAKFRQHNVGTTSVAPGWTGRIYLSADAACCSGDVQIGTYTQGTAFAAGSYTDAAQTVTIPTGTTPGNYYVFANLDATGLVAESNEANNAKPQVEVLSVTSTPLPDLIPNPVSINPPIVAPTAIVEVTVHEVNAGSASASAGWTGRIYLSTDTSCCTGDVLLDTYNESNAIAAGGSRDVVRMISIPAGTATGAYRVFAWLDATGLVSEANESNNIGVSATTLTVTNLVACATFEGTTTWKVTDQVFNAGCSTTGPSMRYRWQTDSGGPWTPYTTATQYEFLGHGAAGTHKVTVEALDTATAVSITHAYTLTVQNLQLTITGPTEVLDKLTKTYTASTSATWYERIPPGNWGAGIGPQVTYTRIWTQGCYSVDLRAGVNSGGVLRRGRLTINVASAPGCDPEP